MLEVQNQKHFDDVKAFADRMIKSIQLQEKLDYLDTYADPENKGLTKCILGYDFAPYSFAFSMLKRDDEGAYKFWFNGGLIFDSSLNNWSVHT